jgi:hypothetical protein
MPFVESIMETPMGSNIISVILGLGLAVLFRRVCHGRNCIEIRGPKPSEMEGKIFGFNNKCYKYDSQVKSCPVQLDKKL